MVQSNSAEDRKLSSSFEMIRKELLQTGYADRWDKPLAYWALPNDRRLPLAFLGKSVGELLRCSFDELSRTRGVGQKKIGSLVKLLHRATNDAPPAAPFGLPELVENQSPPPANPGEADSFDPTTVSEAQWDLWCQTVRRFHVDHLPLGRLAPSLQALPTVIWETPLREYAGRTLMDIRQMRTHGEKRVRVVMEVFFAIDQLLGPVEAQTHLAFVLVPAVVPPLESFIARTVAENREITLSELKEQVIRPLVRQIQIDSGEMIHDLVRQRLGLDLPQRSVREQASDLGVTRARIYQMLEDCTHVFAVRWPAGAEWMRKLAGHVSAEAHDSMRLLQQICFSSDSRDHGNYASAVIDREEHPLEVGVGDDS